MRRIWIEHDRPRAWNNTDGLEFGIETGIIGRNTTKNNDVVT